MNRKLRLLFWIGIVVLLFPLLGIPEWAKMILLVLIGSLLIYLAYTLKHAFKKLVFERRTREEGSVEEATQEINHG